jgi:hypothetical protein
MATYWTGAAINDSIERQSIRNAIWTAGVGGDRLDSATLFRVNRVARRLIDVSRTAIGERENHFDEDVSGDVVTEERSSKNELC